ncbi:hypothetical protein [Elioraea rosea]|uniref:hypothetical protein n=1 Tax=Elioraea rosea TaxID=2492390 RepID=UPI00118689D3|nr:hypothetical protein [Elioraea rosea]
MFRGLYRLLVAVGDWRPINFLIAMVAVELLAVLAVVSVGFGTFAVYMHLAASKGHIYAALVISVSYGVVAIVAGVALWRWHARSSRQDDPALAALGDPELLVQSLSGPGVWENQAALSAALRLGRELRPMDLLAISLISGFLAGRRARK